MVFTNNAGACQPTRSQVETLAKVVGITPRETDSIEYLLQAIYTEILQLRSSIRALHQQIQSIQAVLNIQQH